MHAGNGDVGPYDAVAAEDHTWVRDAVATRGHPLSENSPEFAKPARYALVAMSKMDLASIVSKVAKFGPRSEVRTLSEDGIADVVEVRRLRSGKKNGVLDLGRMTDHGVGTNPGVLPHIGPATYNRSGADVARPDEVGSSFYRGRFIDDDAVSTREKSRIWTSDGPFEGSHLCFQTFRMVRVKHGPNGTAGWQRGNRTVFVARKRREEGGRIGEVSPVHAPAKRPLGINVVMTYAARW